MWKQLDQVENRPVRLTDDDECFCARDYASGKDYSYSEANSLIKNFKKPVSTRNTNQWYWKERAIKQFANELAGWLGTLEEEFSIAAIPPSKRRDDAEYDPRLDMVLDQFAGLCPHAKVVRPIERTINRTPAHLSGGNRPSVEDVYESLTWEGLVVPPTTLILIDDIITAGTSFKACKRLALHNNIQLEVYGVFWARTIWIDDPLQVSN
ncbi:hypothetical protein [Gimesia sp.]|uniref:hypothetical protein n=1 Tax=Gimesia sp. TaxID=2024833 RepID=UPI0025BC9BA6|nr:hypothetical protein [Gimesia sp.]